MELLLLLLLLLLLSVNRCQEQTSCVIAFVNTACTNYDIKLISLALTHWVPAVQIRGVWIYVYVLRILLYSLFVGSIFWKSCVLLQRKKKKISHIPKITKYFNPKIYRNNKNEKCGQTLYWEDGTAYLEIFLLKMADVCRRKWSSRRALSRHWR